MKHIIYILLMTVPLILSGCSSVNIREDVDKTKPKERKNDDFDFYYIVPEKDSSKSKSQSISDWKNSFNSRVTESLSNREALKLVLKNLGETGFQKKDFNHLLIEVDRMVKRFQGPRKQWYQKALSRAEKYMPMIHDVFNEKKIPLEMAWLALIESGFTYDIKSVDGARGMWQFMPQTAKEYGLKVSRKVDQRIDPYRATKAARDYLLDRVAVYGSDSFLLVAASYNAGEGRISRSLRKLDDPFAQRNFIGVSKFLPKETRGYVPQLLAAAIIGRNPGAYGFKTDVLGKYAYLQLARPTSIEKLAKYSGLSANQLRALNPELGYKRRKTPMNNFIVRVPAASAASVVANNDTVKWWQGEQQREGNSQLAKLDLRSKPEKSTRKSIKRKVHSKSVKKGSRHKIKTVLNKRNKTKVKGLYVHYRVQRGNKLTDIGHWFNKSVSQLKGWNPKIPTSGKIKIGQVIKVYGLPRNLKKTLHKIHAGESLSTLAQHYQVSQQRLKAWNGIRSNRIYSGQTILVYHHADPKIAQNSVEKIIYKVKSGNYLAGVAALFDVSIAQVQRWNRLKNGHIYAGQQLVVNVPRSVKKKRYTVKRGDSFSLIAKRIKIQPQDLQFINGLKNIGNIRVGQILVYFTV